MWAQNWINIQDIVKPYPEEMFVLDVTDALVSQNYTAKKMFELSEEFFTLGFRDISPLGPILEFFQAKTDNFSKISETVFSRQLEWTP